MSTTLKAALAAAVVLAFVPSAFAQAKPTTKQLESRKPALIMQSPAPSTEELWFHRAVGDAAAH